MDNDEEEVLKEMGICHDYHFVERETLLQEDLHKLQKTYKDFKF